MYFAKPKTYKYKGIGTIKYNYVGHPRKHVIGQTKNTVVQKPIYGGDLTSVSTACASNTF